VGNICSDYPFVVARSRVRGRSRAGGDLRILKAALLLGPQAGDIAAVIDDRFEFAYNLQKHNLRIALLMRASAAEDALPAAYRKRLTMARLLTAQGTDHRSAAWTAATAAGAVPHLGGRAETAVARGAAAMVEMDSAALPAQGHGRGGRGGGRGRARNAQRHHH
jgi:hypothetical protein